jgi:hypothetical protein
MKKKSPVLPVVCSLVFLFALLSAVNYGAEAFGYGESVVVHPAGSYDSGCAHRYHHVRRTCFGPAEAGYGYYVSGGERHRIAIVNGFDAGRSFDADLAPIPVAPPFGRVYNGIAWPIVWVIVSFFVTVGMFMVSALQWDRFRISRRVAAGTGESQRAAAAVLPPRKAEAKRARFASLGLGYTHTLGADSETLQEVRGPYRGCGLYVMAECRWIGYQGSTYGDGGVEAGARQYRSSLRVAVTIEPTVRHLFVYPLRERGSQDVVEKESRFDKFFRGNDVFRSAHLRFPQPAPTGVGEFDARFGIDADSDLARTMLSPELLGWIAADPRSEHFRIMVFRNELSACFLGPVVASPDDILDAEHIFPAADYLIDLAAHVPPEAFRLAPATEPAAPGR